MPSAILGDEVEVWLGGEAVVLRPTLRAAIEAYRLRGDFAKLARALAEGDSEVLQRLPAIGSGRDVSDLMGTMGWAEMAMLGAPLIRYVMILASGGVEPKDRDEATEPGELSHEAYFARLFKLGTGWIGWTPDETLDATMPAIISAYAGRMDLLSTIFGDGKPAGRNAIPLDEKVRAIFDHMGTTKVDPA